ncbi:DUF502 domain-containing protein [Thermodesulfobacteriota bacterium]
MKSLSRVFVTGLVSVLPMLATIYILIWLGSTAESILGKLIRLVLPGDLYRLGMGVLAGVVIVFLIGIFMRAVIVRKLVDWGEGVLYRIPMVKTIYGSFRDFLQFVSGPGKEGDRKRAVMVQLGNSGMEVMGLITRREFQGLPSGIGSEGQVAVYLPMSYQLGGHTVIVPQSAVRPVEISMEEAMRFVLTAGMVSKPPASQGKKP